jgi:hypothetical protein
MSINETRPCTCGSGKPSTWQKDARGIPLCRTCDDCHAQKMSGYRPEVLTDGDYEADEPIEGDDDVYGDDGPHFA